MRILFKDSGSDEPTVVLEAASVDAVPDTIASGPADWGGAAGYARQLADRGCTVRAILSRMGREAYAVLPDERDDETGAWVPEKDRNLAARIREARSRVRRGDGLR